MGNIILSYLSDLFDNYGLYTWKISDYQTVKKILRCKNGDKFMSDPFTISRLKCQLIIYPNGDKQELDGYFVIQFHLLSLPKYVKNVRFGRIFRVLENQSAA